jgi:hypothetical protein
MARGQALTRRRTTAVLAVHAYDSQRQIGVRGLTDGPFIETKEDLGDVFVIELGEPGSGVSSRRW